MFPVTAAPSVEGPLQFCVLGGSPATFMANAVVDRRWVELGAGSRILVRVHSYDTDQNNCVASLFELFFSVLLLTIGV